MMDLPSPASGSLPDVPHWSTTTRQRFTFLDTIGDEPMERSLRRTESDPGSSSSSSWTSRAAQSDPKVPSVPSSEVFLAASGLACSPQREEGSSRQKQDKRDADRRTIQGELDASQQAEISTDTTSSTTDTLARKRVPLQLAEHLGRQWLPLQGSAHALRMQEVPQVLRTESDLFSRSAPDTPDMSWTIRANSNSHSGHGKGSGCKGKGKAGRGTSPSSGRKAKPTPAQRLADALGEPQHWSLTLDPQDLLKKQLGEDHDGKVCRGPCHFYQHEGSCSFGNECGACHHPSHRQKGGKTMSRKEKSEANISRGSPELISNAAPAQKSSTIISL